MIGTLVFLMKPHQRLSWIFFLFGATFGLMLTFLVKLEDLKPHWLGTIHILFYTFTPATFIHLAMSFPEERNLIKKHPYAQVLPYFISILLFILIRWNTPILADAPKYLSMALTAYLVIAMIIFLGSCFQLWMTSKSEIAKIRSKMILLGAAISASIPLSETVINSIFRIHLVPGFNYYLPFLVVFPSFVGYSIVKHNLFEIDTIIKRTYGYVLTTGTIAGVYGLVVLISNLAFTRFEITKSPLFPLLFVLAVVFFFNPIRNKVQKFIDRVFYRLEYDYREVVQRISESLRSLLSLDEIGKRIMDNSLGVMFIESGSVFLLNPEIQVYESLTAPGSKLILPAHDPLLQKMAEKRKEITPYDIQEDPLFEPVRATCQKSIERLGATLLVPLIYEDSIMGFISLGNKKSGKFYRREDINLLKILANQGAVAIENSKLHQARIDALEQSKKELERLNLAKSRALDHLSHELKTPLSVIQGNIRILKRKFQAQTSPTEGEKFFETLGKQLNRLIDIQQETDNIIRSHQELEGKLPQISREIKTIQLFPFLERTLEKVKQKVNHRTLRFQLAFPRQSRGLNKTVNRSKRIENREPPKGSVYSNIFN
jgi:hypothetical protein